MATFYAKPNLTSWTDTAGWSTISSSGASGSAVPGVADDVIFDAGSGSSRTVTGTWWARSLNTTGAAAMTFDSGRLHGGATVQNIPNTTFTGYLYVGVNSNGASVTVNGNFAAKQLRVTTSGHGGTYTFAGVVTLTTAYDGLVVDGASSATTTANFAELRMTMDATATIAAYEEDNGDGTFYTGPRPFCYITRVVPTHYDVGDIRHHSSYNLEVPQRNDSYGYLQVSELYIANTVANAHYNINLVSGGVNVYNNAPTSVLTVRVGNSGQYQIPNLRLAAGTTTRLKYHQSSGASYWLNGLTCEGTQESPATLIGHAMDSGYTTKPQLVMHASLPTIQRLNLQNIQFSRQGGGSEATYAFRCGDLGGNSGVKFTYAKGNFGMTF
jgi:hypothetical protein